MAVKSIGVVMGNCCLEEAAVKGWEEVQSTAVETVLLTVQ